ncbi:MAG: YybS family protein [Candidatus Alkaliphilus sp. MAG34]|nr:YybS family protein [Clostridiales bacterium]
MRNYDERKAFVEAALIAAITTVLTVSVVYIPILSVSIMLVPVPFIILAYRHGNRYSILSFVTFSLLIGILVELIYAGFLLLVFGPMILAMGHFIKKQKEPYAVIGIGTAISVLSMLIILQIASYIGNVNIVDEIALAMESIVSKQVDMLKNMNIDALSADEVLNYLLMIVPGVFVIQSMITAFGNYYIAINILKRFDAGNSNTELPQFSNFKLPKNIVFGFVVIFILSYLTRYVKGIYHANLLTNVTLLFVFIFFVQGMSVISHLIKRTKIPKAIRIFLLVVILFISPLLTVISFVGLLDAIVNIRNIG